MWFTLGTPLPYWLQGFLIGLFVGMGISVFAYHSGFGLWQMKKFGRRIKVTDHTDEKTFRERGSVILPEYIATTNKFYVLHIGKLAAGWFDIAYVPINHPEIFYHDPRYDHHNLIKHYEGSSTKCIKKTIKDLSKLKYRVVSEKEIDEIFADDRQDEIL
jgi:hypothetical protein